MRMARAEGIRTIAFTGVQPGPMGDLSDVTITVPSNITQHIQETHITIGHVICQLVEEELFKLSAS
jgi:D-sedoheptulose 7-phosphate isomerase